MHQSPAYEMLYSPSVLPQLADDTTLAPTNGEDMKGYDGIMYLISVGATDITVDAKVRSGAAAASSGHADITGAVATQVAADEDNRLIIIDVWRPTERYVSPLITIGNGTTGANVSVVACRYRKAGLTPVTQVAEELVTVAEN